MLGYHAIIREESIMSYFLLHDILYNFIIAGQEQHIGTKAPPLEIALENSIMPTEPVVRVQVRY